MLQKNSISLRALRESDRDILYKWINDRSMVHFNDCYAPISQSSHDSWFENKCLKLSHSYMFMIERIDTSNTIGSCQVNNVMQTERSASLQIRIAEKDQRGKGFGSIAINLLLDFCYLDLNLHRVQISCYSNNVAAQKTYSKCGFKVEGCRRQATYINGEWLDIIVMGILRSEYDTLKID